MDHPNLIKRNVTKPGIGSTGIEVFFKLSEDHQH